MDVFHSQFRFIPVGTGNTFHKTTCILQATVHPRGHGEHITSLALNEPSAGSSPWARGTLILIFFCNASTRFIPVGTGNTVLRCRFWLKQPVHPRGHGEHSNYRQLFYKGNKPIGKSTRILKIKVSLKLIRINR